MSVLLVNKYFWRKGGSEAVFFNEMNMLNEIGVKAIPFSMYSRENYESEYSDYFVEEVNYESNKIYDKAIAASKVIYSFDAKRKIEKLLTVEVFELAHFHIFQHQISPSVFGRLLKKKCTNYSYFTRPKAYMCKL